MNRLIAFITGLHVLAHGVFGCCDHASLGFAASDHVLAACNCHHASHGNHTEYPQGNDAAKPESPSHEPHQCVHANCHWLAGSPTAATDALDLNTMVAMLAMPHNAIPIAAATEFLPNVAAAQLAAPPLRLHLALGVLLI